MLRFRQEYSLTAIFLLYSTTGSILLKRGLFTLLCVTLLAPSFSAQATWRGDKRQDARDIRQDSREQGRDTKQECVRNNNQSNASCRHDKRENRREGRQEARDEKW